MRISSADQLFIRRSQLRRIKLDPDYQYSFILLANVYIHCIYCSEFNRHAAGDFVTLNALLQSFVRIAWNSASDESLFAFDTFALGLISMCFRYADTYIGLYFFSVIA